MKALLPALAIFLMVDVVAPQVSGILPTANNGQDFSSVRYTGLSCEGQSLHMFCPPGYYIKIHEVFFGRNDTTTCIQDKTKVTNDTTCTVPEATTMLRKYCGDSSRSCYAPSSVGLFGLPYPCHAGISKFLRVSFSCEQTVYRVLMCEASGTLPLTCPAGQLIVPLSAFYGREDRSETVCPHPTLKGQGYCATNNAFDVFSSLCDGKNKCEINAGNNLFGDPCFGAYKYLKVAYSCAECTNAHSSDAECEYWANIGNCTSNAAWMVPNCRKACWRCDPSPPECKNEYRDGDCELWASKGQCTSNPAWMIPFCRKACLKCHDSSLTICENKYQPEGQCEVWETEGQCITNFDYMLPNCGKACMDCTDFVKCENKWDYPSQCEQWKSQGECDNNPGFMLTQCRQSCTGCAEYQSMKCENKHSSDAECNQWFADLECKNNPEWMFTNCWKACTQCAEPDDCMNQWGNDAECEFWRLRGECSSNVEFMMANCSKTCTGCMPKNRVANTTEVTIPGCQNLNANDTECELWARAGECQTNAPWMITYCRKACTYCHEDALAGPIVGNPIVPGEIADVTKDMTMLLTEFKGISSVKLTHFVAFFVNTNPVTLQVWRPRGSTYLLMYEKRVIPASNNTAQTILATNLCTIVRNGDRIGFTTERGMAVPIAYNYDTNSLNDVIYFRRRTSGGMFDWLPLPFRFSLAAGYETDLC